MSLFRKNIYNIKNEINYDKLAEAIVRAKQIEAKKNKQRPNRVRGAVMAAANTIIPIIFAIFTILTCIGMWVEFSTESTLGLIECIAHTLLLAVVLIISVCCSIEAWKDDDESAISHFNTNVALVALIVALITLFKV